MSRHDEHAWRAGIEARTTTTWTQPSRCNRKRRSWLCRLLGR